MVAHALSPGNLVIVPLERRRASTGTMTLVCMVNCPLADVGVASGQLSRCLLA